MSSRSHAESAGSPDWILGVAGDLAAMRRVAARILHDQPVPGSSTPEVDGRAAPAAARGAREVRSSPRMAAASAFPPADPAPEPALADIPARTIPSAPPWSLAAVRFVPAVVVLAAAAGLRLWRLDAVGLNSDEAVYSGQAAALAGDSALAEFFSVFRAHPLLLQLTLGGLFRVVGVSDLAARAFVSILFGVGAVILTYVLARRLYGSGIALGAAAILAVVPYHVLVSRQVLVDTPFAFFVLLTLILLVRFTERPTTGRLVLVGVGVGLATLTKEVGVLLLPLIAIWLLASGHFRKLKPGPALLSLAAASVVVSPFVISRLVLAPRSSSQYVSWQLSRPPNHGQEYFLEVVMQFGSVVLLVLGVAGLLVALLRRSGADLLLLTWLLVFVAFFQLWPTKLFPYLIVVFPAIVIASAVGLQGAFGVLGRGFRSLPRTAPSLTPAAGLVLLALTAYLAATSFTNVKSGPDGAVGPFALDIEVQDFAGGREAGQWALAETPANAAFLTIGPSMGNLLRFYGHRHAVALSVSPDPRKRNPAYAAIPNPDLLIRRLGVQYAVWDFYSADRSAFYNGLLMRYVRKYEGHLVFAAYELADGSMWYGRAALAREDAEPRVLVYNLAEGPAVLAAAR